LKFGYLGVNGVVVLRGWSLRGDIVYVIAYSSLALSILVWLQLKETGLLADPGYLSLYLAIFNKEDIQKDFEGFEDEDHRWIVRRRLAHNQCRIGYWDKGVTAEGVKEAVYGIRRTKTSESTSQSVLPGSPTKYPEFHYVPWFLKSSWIATWTSILAAGIAIMATLVI
jgi:hypothetical protein